eukprot:644067-Hanusia_phi.AAC.1
MILLADTFLPIIKGILRRSVDSKPIVLQTGPERQNAEEEEEEEEEEEGEDGGLISLQKDREGRRKEWSDELREKIASFIAYATTCSCSINLARKECRLSPGSTILLIASSIPEAVSSTEFEHDEPLVRTHRGWDRDTLRSAQSSSQVSSSSSWASEGTSVRASRSFRLASRKESRRNKSECRRRRESWPSALARRIRSKWSNAVSALPLHPDKTPPVGKEMPSRAAHLTLSILLKPSFFSLPLLASSWSGDGEQCRRKTGRSKRDSGGSCLSSLGCFP